MGDISPEINQFLKYIENSTEEMAAGYDFLRNLHAEVQKIRSNLLFPLFSLLYLQQLRASEKMPKVLPQKQITSQLSPNFSKTVCIFDSVGINVLERVHTMS
ncbi:hypothetical protein AGMMS49975_13660 [Clostridia bacterium]|nr:hypothetical protein AGMMS49975_13660 [Clostridia bacterium]